MLNKKGFALTEVLVVTVFLVSIFTFIYMSVIPLIGRYEDNIERVKDIDVVYKLYHIREMIKNDANASVIMSESPNAISCDDLSEENQEYCTNLLSQLDVSNGEIYYIKDVNYETIDSFENGEISEYLRHVLHHSYEKCMQYYDIYSEYDACIKREKDHSFIVLRDNNKHNIAHLKYNASPSCPTGNMIPSIQQVVTSGDGLYKDESDSNRYIYRGTNPKNYIYFAGSLWRIVSLEVDNRMKIVSTTPGNGIYDEVHRATSYYCNTGYGCNAWGKKHPHTGMTVLPRVATLNTYLNGEYLTNLKTKNVFGLLENVTFFTGGIDANNNNYNGTAEDIRILERRVTEKGTVGLINLSDYMKASTDERCKTFVLSLSANSGFCAKKNWLTPSSTSFIMTPQYDNWMWMLTINNSGLYTGLYPNKYPQDYYPVVYLDSTLPISGNGTEDDPFVIGDWSTCQSNNPAVNSNCAITTPEGYDSSKVLTINSNLSGVEYSWDGVTYGSTNTKTVNAAGTYTGYVKKISTGSVKECSITINSRTEYQHATKTGCKACYYCSSGIKYTTSGYAYCCIGNISGATTREDCEGGIGEWCSGLNRCGRSLTVAEYSSNCSSCGCNWSTSDTKWYTDSCGSSTSCSNSCYNKASRTAYGVD